jgi:hypothetical protein
VLGKLESHTSMSDAQDDSPDFAAAISVPSGSAPVPALASLPTTSHPDAHGVQISTLIPPGPGSTASPEMMEWE